MFRIRDVPSLRVPNEYLKITHERILSHPYRFSYHSNPLISHSMLRNFSSWHSITKPHYLVTNCDPETKNKNTTCSLNHQAIRIADEPRDAKCAAEIHLPKNKTVNV
jgi:hypothetical protein